MNSKIIIGVIILASAALLASPALAQNSSSTPTSSTPDSSTSKTTPVKSTSITKKMAAMQTQAEKEIDRRVTSLTNLITKVQGLRNVTDAQKIAIVSSVQAEITDLSNLKTQIMAETSGAALTTEFQSITKAYRIYALVIPEINIITSADRTVTLANMLSVIAGKLQSRIVAAGTIANQSAITTAMSDLTAKITDVTAQAQAAATEVSTLAPDEGDKTKMAANTAALKDAQSKLKTAQADIKAARSDITEVTKALKKIKVPVTTATNDGRTNDATSTGTSTVGH